MAYNWYRKLGLVITISTSLAMLYSCVSSDFFLKRRNLPSKNEVSSLPAPGRSCSNQVFREYFVKHGSLPESGHWNETDGRPEYSLDICRYKNTPEQTVHKCLLSDAVNNIVMMGDSNGGKYHQALVHLLHSATGVKCLVLRKERPLHDGFVPDISYYKTPNTAWDPYLRVNYRYCKGCPSSSNQCTTTNRYRGTVVVEHLSMTMVLDDSVQLSVPFDGPRMDRFQFRALTTQEFFLRYYLKNKYPDILVIFLPFNHAKNIALAQARADLTYFHTMVKLYVPDSTNIFYISNLAEFEHTRSDARFVNRTFEGRLAADQINSLNHLLFDVIRDDLLRENTNIYGFLDLWKASVSRGDWSVDGVHMRPAWYTSVMSMLLEHLCEG